MAQIKNPDRREEPDKVKGRFFVSYNGMATQASYRINRDISESSFLAKRRWRRLTVENYAHIVASIETTVHFKTTFDPVSFYLVSGDTTVWSCHEDICYQDRSKNDKPYN